MPVDGKVYSEQCNEEKPSKFNEETHPLTEKSCNESLESGAVSFEEAISMTGQGKFHNILQLGYGLCLVSMITEIINTAYLLPSAECDFNMTSGDKGILTAICYVGMIASSHLWGFMADIKGRKFTLVRTLLLDGICALISSFSHTYWLFLILRFFSGFFICGPSAVVYAYMGEFHSEATRSRAIMWGAVFISGAIMALPGVAWIIMYQSWSFEFPLYTYHPWRLFVIICGLPSFLTAVIFIVYLPESPKFLLSQDREEEALHVLHYMFTQNTGNDPQHYKVKCLLRECRTEEKNYNKHKKKTVLAVLDLMWAQTKPLFLSPHFSRTLLGCSLMFGIYASFNGLLLWLPDMFNRLAEYGQLHPGASATVCEVISAIASNVTSVIKNATTSSITAAVLSSPTTLTDPVASGTSINENLMELVNETMKCSAVVAPTVFTKSLIIGGSSAFANIACVFLIAYVGKKNILVTCMLLSAISGFAILLARSTLALLILSCILEGLVMTSPIVLNSILVDIFPTHLRAMAVCISMLMGRLGTVLSSSILGILLEVNCNLVFITLGGMLLVCGGLGYLLPSPWQWKVRR